MLSPLRERNPNQKINQTRAHADKKRVHFADKSFSITQHDENKENKENLPYESTPNHSSNEKENFSRTLLAGRTPYQVIDAFASLDTACIPQNLVGNYTFALDPPLTNAPPSHVSVEVASDQQISTDLNARNNQLTLSQPLEFSTIKGNDDVPATTGQHGNLKDILAVYWSPESQTGNSIDYTQSPSAVPTGTEIDNYFDNYFGCMVSAKNSFYASTTQEPLISENAVAPMPHVAASIVTAQDTAKRPTVAPIPMLSHDNVHLIGTGIGVSLNKPALSQHVNRKNIMPLAHAWRQANPSYQVLPKSSEFFPTSNSDISTAIDPHYHQRKFDFTDPTVPAHQDLLISATSTTTVDPLIKASPPLVIDQGPGQCLNRRSTESTTCCDSNSHNEGYDEITTVVDELWNCLHSGQSDGSIVDLSGSHDDVHFSRSLDEVLAASHTNRKQGNKFLTPDFLRIPILPYSIQNKDSLPDPALRIPCLPYSVHIHRAHASTPLINKFGPATRMINGSSIIETFDNSAIERSHCHGKYSDLYSEESGNGILNASRIGDIENVPTYVNTLDYFEYSGGSSNGHSCSPLQPVKNSTSSHEHFHDSFYIDRNEDGMMMRADVKGNHICIQNTEYLHDSYFIDCDAVAGPSTLPIIGIHNRIEAPTISTRVEQVSEDICIPNTVATEVKVNSNNANDSFFSAATTITLDSRMHNQVKIPTTTVVWNTVEKSSQICPYPQIVVVNRKELTHERTHSQNMKEVDMFAYISDASESQLVFQNKRKKVLKLRTNTIITRFELSNKIDIANNNNVSFSTNILNPFTVHPKEIELKPNCQVNLTIRFEPTASIDGIYSGVMKLFTSKKTFIILLRGTATRAEAQKTSSEIKLPSTDPPTEQNHWADCTSEKTIDSPAIERRSNSAPLNDSAANHRQQLKDLREWIDQQKQNKNISTYLKSELKTDNNCTITKEGSSLTAKSPEKKSATELITATNKSKACTTESVVKTITASDDKYLKVEILPHKNKGLFFRRSVVSFGSVERGTLSRLRIELCNCTDQQIVVYIEDPVLPFVLLHNEVSIRPRCYVRLPVRFVPVKGPSQFAGKLVAKTADGYYKTTVDLVGSSY